MNFATSHSRTARYLSPPIALLAFMCCDAISSDTGFSLRIESSGAVPGKGQALLSLFNSPHNYMKQPVFESVQPIDEYGTAVFQLNDLKPGTYAFNVIYDEDSDGKLDTGFLGIPTEKVGFSNQARGSFGPPKFNKASFQLEADTTMKITFTRARD